MKDITKLFIVTNNKIDNEFYAWRYTKTNGVISWSYIRKHNNTGSWLFNSKRFIIQTIKKFYPDYRIISGQHWMSPKTRNEYDWT
jgi:hypothetical protein